MIQNFAQSLISWSQDFFDDPEVCGIRVSIFLMILKLVELELGYLRDAKVR